MLSKKDIIEINKKFSNGRIVNENSIDYAVQTNASSKNWLRSAATISRAILTDYVFEDGNKRTATAVIMLLMDLNKIDYNREEIPRIVIKILRKKLVSINEIERSIKNGII